MIVILQFTCKARLVVIPSKREGSKISRCARNDKEGNGYRRYYDIVSVGQLR